LLFVQQWPLDWHRGRQRIRRPPGVIRGQNPMEILLYNPDNQVTINGMRQIWMLLLKPHCPPLQVANHGQPNLWLRPDVSCNAGSNRMLKRAVAAALRRQPTLKGLTLWRPRLGGTPLRPLCEILQQPAKEDKSASEGAGWKSRKFPRHDRPEQFYCRPV
jgi:hypothetical protein